MSAEAIVFLVIIVVFYRVSQLFVFLFVVSLKLVYFAAIVVESQRWLLTSDEDF